MKRIHYIIKSFAGILVFNSILFLSAGRIDYYQGWLYTGMSILGLLLNYSIAGRDDELLEERSKPPKDAKEWDKHILKLSALATVIAYIVAGIDSGRYHWSSAFPLYAGVAGIVFMFIGQLLFLAAKKTNRFFSSVVRIQHDRGHTVCDSGPYSYVRHPGYSGMILSWCGFPLILDSVWSAIPVSFALLLIVIRTHLEDAALKAELSGYIQYTAKTRYRLVPGIW